MIRSTTIVGLRHKGKIALGGDGQVSIEDTIMKSQANKIRKVYGDKILAGFAGSAADAFTLFDKFEKKLEQFHGNLSRASVELAKDWRTDRILRRLEALLAVIDHEHSYVISGVGDVIEPDDGIVAIGSGGAYALAAARALVANSKMDAKQIVEHSLHIAASICIYTNDNLFVETLE
jgi:ATP-dependent HslUV protease subunit HslV